MNSFDIDGVVYINKDIPGVNPGINDVIITGRSYEESEETYRMLKARGINNVVYFNPLPYSQKTRESSGIHKAKTLNMLQSIGYNINFHAEDDPIQIEQIKLLAPWVNIIYMDHNLTYKENQRHE